MALAVLLAQAAACVGFGAILLKALRIDCADRLNHFCLAFAAGFGVLGWGLFFLGIAGFFQPMALGLVLAVGVTGLPLLKSPQSTATPPLKWNTISWVLLALLALVLALDVFEALPPPTDADSLAYHFAAPRQFIQAGRIEFILRPLDGAIPYLVQMTYVPVLALGGEQAMTLWTMLSGWMAIMTLFALARPYLGANGSLAVALLTASLPITIYAAGTGQIEIRMALFAMVSCWAVGQALSAGTLRHIVLAGIGAGFYAGAKYLGLLFVAGLGLTVLLHRRWLTFSCVFALAVIVAGGQWYAWNAVHTGDPVFPMLFPLLGRSDLGLWTLEQDAFFKSGLMEADRPIARTLVNLLLYPFWVTLNAPEATEGRQVGLGPYGWVMTPFILYGLWLVRHRIRRGPILVYGTSCIVFFVLWFVTGSSQRVRHLLPMAPLLILCMAVLVRQVGLRHPALRPILYFALGACLTFQLAITGLFGVKYVRYAFAGQSDQQYLEANLTVYAPVPWINANLGADDKLFIGERQLFYYLTVPYLFMSPHTQSAVDLRGRIDRWQDLHRQLIATGLTHVLLRGETPFSSAWGDLIASSCLMPMHEFQALQIGSRTLSARSAETVLRLYQVQPVCPGTG